jgi:aminopeptidase-like protein
MMLSESGKEISYLTWMKDLFPLNRSLSGSGNRQTLDYLREKTNNLEIKSIPCGSQAFDWTVPPEWKIVNAYIESKDGRRFADFSNNNLHVVQYSSPIDQIVTKAEITNHIHILEDNPDAIPYVTSYYSPNWGFCMSKREFESMGDGPFRVHIESSFISAPEGGELAYGQVLIPGDTKQEVLFSTYICHPSMANNELSGPVVATALAQMLNQRKLHYTYRFLFLPETIGAIYFLSRNLEQMRENLIAGFVLTCIGDSGNFSYIPSRLGNNYADRCAKGILKEYTESFVEYSWLDRGSDERQYCAPGVDLPVCSITRSKHGTYPEYHTSLDNLSLITESSLRESIFLLARLIEKIENQRVPKLKIRCEPQLGKRGLFPNLSTNNSHTKAVMEMMDVISFFDGGHSLADISQKTGVTLTTVAAIVEKFRSTGLLEV